MKVIYNDKRDITKLVEGITLSGDNSTISRTLELETAKNLKDKFIPRLVPGLGRSERISLYSDSGKEIFYGLITDLDYDVESLKILCEDNCFYLNKSKTSKNYKNRTAESIAKDICLSLGVTPGDLVKTGVKQSFVALQKTGYEIIMTAYTNASKKTGKKYIAYIEDRKLVVVERGKRKAKVNIDEDTNLLEINYSESMQNMKNKIIVVDDNDKQIDVVQNKTDLTKYGMVQDFYKKEDGVDYKEAAKNALRGIERDITVSTLGQDDYITGNAVEVHRQAGGLKSLFYIDSDTHRFENGVHATDLTLNFQNIMDEKEIDDTKKEVEKEKKEVEVASSKTSSSNSKRKRFISAAESFAGWRYSQSKRMSNGYVDCSSLVGRAMVKAGLTSNAFVTTRSMVGDKRFYRIPKSKVKAGDILWKSGHVGVYLGNGRIIEAANPRRGVIYTKLGKRFTCGYRIRGIDS